MQNKLISGTCLAVIRETQDRKRKGELVFAADRRVSWGREYQETTFPKVVKRNGVILAGTGLASMIEIITRLIPIPDCPEKMDGFSYIHSLFTDSIKEVLISKGFHTDQGFLAFPKKINTSILIGVKKSFFVMQFDEEMGIIINSFNTPYADGCGGMYALGSLLTTEQSKMSSEDRLTLALSVAAEVSSGCDDRIDIIRESDPDSE